MNNRRVLVFGSNGLLGQKVADLLLRVTPASVTLSSFESIPVRPM